MVLCNLAPQEVHKILTWTKRALTISHLTNTDYHIFRKRQIFSTCFFLWYGASREHSGQPPTQSIFLITRKGSNITPAKLISQTKMAVCGLTNTQSRMEHDVHTSINGTAYMRFGLVFLCLQSSNTLIRKKMWNRKSHHCKLGSPAVPPCASCSGDASAREARSWWPTNTRCSWVGQDCCTWSGASTVTRSTITRPAAALTWRDANRFDARLLI